jgi:hypothetical protein
MNSTDPHLDIPARGDWVEFSALGDYGQQIDARGEVTNVYPRVRRADITADCGRRHKRVDFTDLIVISRPA